MIRNRLYYRVKPLVPAHVRMSVRRWFAVRKRQRVLGTWPILPGSEKPPANWPGWPDGKKFAFVLTHDVEGQAGLDKCRQLMELEIKLGFRSSFNFIPEGEYQVPLSLIDELKANGFEVGVHDLHHDGKLYRSRQEFARKAARINIHLRNWEAAGFRSGFMLHNLEWLHDLEAAYDASTFDTDPFEPQPDGVGTIFPFWVPAPNASAELGVRSAEWANSNGKGSAIKPPLHTLHSELRTPKAGYVELPYTLPQDSTLFLLLRERHPDIWFQKLDWIAKHGGLALLPTHPDYMAMNSSCRSGCEYPVAYLERVLGYLSQSFAGKYWHALPSEVAQYCRLAGQAASPQGRPRDQLPQPAARRFAGPRNRTLMLVENHYPQDTRVRNEATLLTTAGCEVSVICLRKGEQPAYENVDGVNVHRLPRLELFKKTPSPSPSFLQRLLLKLKSFLGYVVEYLYFTTACFVVACKIHFRRGFDVVHAHNPPDTLFLVGLPFKLLGKKFVFDHHDLCPELYRSRYGAGEGFFTRLLGVFEWCSLRAANITIATNESYKQIQIQRGGSDPEKVFVVRNGPNRMRMASAAPSQRLKGMGKSILCYIGSLNPQDGVDYLLRSLRHLTGPLNRSDFHCVIMGTGDSLEDLRKLAVELEISHCAELTGFVSDEELQSNLAAADICVDPDPSSPLNDVSTWIKIMEYMSQGKPIVTFDLKETRYSAQGAAVYVQPNDEAAFAEAIAALMDDAASRRRMGEVGRRRVEEKLQWSAVGENLLYAYERLLK